MPLNDVPFICKYCSKFCILFQTHLPGYVEKFAALKAKGVEVIACIAVNDPFVMEAWGKAHNADGKVSIFSKLIKISFKF